jgi:ammonia channel protein AmtB
VVAAFFAGVAVRPALARALGYVGPLAVLGVAAAGGVVGGLVFGFLAAASGGAAGPGRLAEVGPDPVAVGLVAALELAVGIGIGLAAATRLPSRGGDARR